MLHAVTSADGVQLACETAGHGPPLVLVHGAGSARWGFDALRPHLEGSFTVTAIDRRGRGDSGDGTDAYAPAREFADVAAVVEAAGAGALLFGHSYGALVAAGACSLLPELPRVILYEPPMGGVLADDAWIRRFETDLEAGGRDRAVSTFLRDVGGYTDVEIAAMRETPAWSQRLAVAPTVPRELRAEGALALASLELGRLALPCLMLMGSQSPEWARRSTAAYAAELPDVRVHTLAGHGHGGTVSAPELVTAAVTSFCLNRPQ